MKKDDNFDEQNKNNKIEEILFDHYLKDENNFLDLEKITFPSIIKPKINPRNLRVFRNYLSKNLQNPIVAARANNFEKINNSIVLQQQNQKLKKLEVCAFDLSRKVDEKAQETGNEINNLDVKIDVVTNNLDELKGKISDLTGQISDLTNKIDNNILNVNTKFDLINKFLEEINKKVCFLKTNLESIKSNIQSNFNTLKTDISNIKRDLIRHIDQLKQTIIHSTQVSIDSSTHIINNNFNDQINRLKIFISNEIKNFKTFFKQKLANQGRYLLLKIGEFITASEAVLVTEIGSLGSTIEASIAFLGKSLLTEILSELGAQTVLIKEMLIPIKNKIKNTFEYLDNFIKNKFKPEITNIIKHWYEKNKEPFKNILRDGVCESIVGESYIKHDASNMFLPTIIFKFKSQNDSDQRSYSQMKLRYNKKAEDITDEDIKELKLKVKNIIDVSYISGSLRCVYVAEKRMFKTTIFAESKTTVKLLLEKIMPITQTNYIEQNISFTENAKRVDYARRKVPLNNIKVNTPDYKSNKVMVISSVFLQINGLKQQIHI